MRHRSLVRRCAATVTLTGALAAVGCGASPTPAPTAPTAPTVPLAAVPAAGLAAPVADRPELRIERDRLTVGEHTVALDGFAAPPGPRGGDRIEPLLGALKSVAAAGPLAGADGTRSITLSIAPDAPYRLVARVLYTAGMAGFGDLGFLVDTDGGVRHIHLPLPQLAPREPPVPGAAPTRCARADTAIGAAGLRVTARAVAEDGGPSLAPVLGSSPVSGILTGGSAAGVLDALGGAGAAPKPLADPPWHGALLVPAAGVCPSAPRRDGRIARAELADLLVATGALAPGCTGGVVTAAFEVRWQDVADVLQVYAANGLTPFLTRGDGDVDGPCDGARVAPPGAGGAG